MADGSARPLMTNEEKGAALAKRAFEAFDELVRNGVDARSALRLLLGPLFAGFEENDERVTKLEQRIAVLEAPRTRFLTEHGARAREDGMHEAVAVCKALEQEHAGAADQGRAYGLAAGHILAAIVPVATENPFTLKLGERVSPESAAAIRDITSAAVRRLRSDPWHCDECGHEHRGPQLANICIGCPCPRTAPKETDSHVE